MLKKLKNKGFTLIELMVVIVIIGVLASLAIPRFTEASNKAKVAEAPRVIASYQSGYLAAVAEKGAGNVASEDIVFSVPTGTESKWWSYATSSVAGFQSGTFAGSIRMTIGKAPDKATLGCTYDANSDTFSHSGHLELLKMVPNFKK